jgi:hypothetical protein
MGYSADLHREALISTAWCCSYSYLSSTGCFAAQKEVQHMTGATYPKIAHPGRKSAIALRALVYLAALITVAVWYSGCIHPDKGVPYLKPELFA